MRNELWLYPVMPECLSDVESLLGNAIRLVCSTFGVDSCVIWPNEYGRRGDCMLLFRSGKCSVVSEDDAEAAVYLRHEPLEMSSETAFRFAFFYSSAGREALSSKAWDAFAMFCNLFYAELMGGFFKSPAPVAVRVENIVKNFHAYPNSPNTLDGVSFRIHRGQLTVLMGPSGSGKSTMLNIIGGILRPDSGSVFYKDSDVCAYSKREMRDYRRNAMGFIFQNYNLIADLTVNENVKIARSLADNPSDVQSALRSVGLENRGGTYPFRLSGGEQQRVCIARALVKNADLLLCDEPTGALDTGNSKTVMTILQGKARESDAAVVVVTHNPQFRALADHYIEMKNGVIETDEYQPFPYQAENYL